jgi:hypothetical protein
MLSLVLAAGLIIAEEGEAATTAGKTELPSMSREFFTKSRLFILSSSPSSIAGLNRLSARRSGGFTPPYLYCFQCQMAA